MKIDREGIAVASRESLAACVMTARFLVVDDQLNMRKLVRTMLIGLGARFIQEASDGVTALKLLEDWNPDVVLLDWDMPSMDGLEFIRQVRSLDRQPIAEVPIIMLTGHGERWRVVEATRYGAHEYLVKPISMKSLLDRIGEVLQKPRAMMRVEGRLVPTPRKLVVLDANF